MFEIAELSHLAKDLFLKLVEEYRDLDARVSTLDDMLVDICRRDDRCKRLTTLPGVGPIVATSLIAAIDDGRHFASGRALSAWIGLVPRQYTRSEEHTSELQSLMRISYAVFCLKKKKTNNNNNNKSRTH